MFLPVFVCLSLCLSVCLSVCEQDYSKRRALIWIKCCMSTDCRNMDELTNVLKFRVAAPIYDIGESNPVPASGLSGSGLKVNQLCHRHRYLSTRNILSKSMHAFLNNLANRQTD